MQNKKQELNIVHSTSMDHREFLGELELNRKRVLLSVLWILILVLIMIGARIGVDIVLSFVQVPDDRREFVLALSFLMIVTFAGMFGLNYIKKRSDEPTSSGVL